MRRTLSSKLLAPPGAALAAGMIWFASSGSAPARAFQTDDRGQCYHVPYPDIDESQTRCTDSSASLFERAAVDLKQQPSSPSPTFRLAASVPSEAPGPVNLRLDPNATGIFLSAWAVENFLAQHYDEIRDAKKAAFVRDWIKKNTRGQDPRLMGIICQYVNDKADPKCDAVPQLKGVSFGAVSALRLYGKKADGKPVVVPAPTRTDAIAMRRTICDILFANRYKREALRLKSKGDSAKIFTARAEDLLAWVKRSKPNR
jgi:hypothetical protein